MLTYTSGDILKADADALVNTVNCVGIMGRGIALQFKNTFPLNFKMYERACQRGEVQPGSMFVFETKTLTNPKYIINFPTKRHWKGKSRIEDIETGLDALKQTIRERKIHSIAVPPLGAGLGGLQWPEVRKRIEEKLGDLAEVRILVFEPKGAPDAKAIAHSTTVPKMTPGRAALVGLMNRYLAELLDPFVTLLEVHKLMYFMQVAGQPLRLNYVQGQYGPYAQNLRNVLARVEGHLISGYADGGDDPRKELQLVPGAAQESEEFLEHDVETRERFSRVSRLVDGFETPFGLELLATVHWLAIQGVSDADQLIAATYAWNDRKRQFSARQIRMAESTLRQEGWLA